MVVWCQSATDFGNWQETPAFVFQSTDLGLQSGIAAWI